MSSSQKDEKLFLSAERVQTMSEELAFQMAKSNFRPTFIMAIWRGGCPTAMIVQEFLECAHKMPIDHIASRTWRARGKRNKTQRVPDFFVEETDEWLVFPHELVGLSREEIAKHRPNVMDKLNALS